MTWKRALGALTALATVVGGACHGYLALPAARNVQHDSDYCPQCLNGPRVCGDPAGRRDHEAFGRFGTSKRVATYPSGGVLRARVVITANHAGRWSLGLCRLRDPSPSTERASLRPACFRKLPLVGGGTYVYLNPSARASVASFRLPRIRCQRCVLRWFYETGNSCNPPGTPARYASRDLDVCGKWMNGETFTNCADIRLR